jgi:hypothetical protein
MTEQKVQLEQQLWNIPRSRSFITSAVKDRCNKKQSIIGLIIRINKTQVSPFLYDEMDLKELNQFILIH